MTGPVPPVDHFPVGTGYRFRPRRNRWVLGLADAVLELDWWDSEADLAVADRWTAEIAARALTDMSEFAVQANEQFHRFDIEVLGDDGEPLVLRVAGDDALEGVGLDAMHLDRKLTIVLVLAVRGEMSLLAPELGKEKVIAPGVILAAPAFTTLRVRGPRTAVATLVVAHARGPSFR